MKKNKLFIFVLVASLFCNIAVFASENSFVTQYKKEARIQQKYEFRGTWVSTVTNIDWPSTSNKTSEQQKQEFLEIVKQSKSMNLNALIVQVRPSADAFYNSAITPWSKYLTGEQGKAPNPYYDPLEFMINATHENNMEFHAWFNPFRVSMDSDLTKLAKNNVAKIHPEWIVNYSGKLFLNPAIPEARKYVIDSVVEVVKNYDIDAVHFDDYFYPSPVKGVEFKDDAQYELYGKGFSNKADWRRNNINIFIKDVGDAIKKEKKYVKFGISPAGVWRNNTLDATGSNTKAGGTNYDELFADTRTWIKNGWIDYIMPQIYWEFSLKAAPYENVLNFWVNEMKLNPNVHLYIGHAAYKINTTNEWKNPAQLTAQIKYNQKFEAIKGSAFFSIKHLIANKLNIKDNFKNEIYKYPAFVPPMTWIDSTAPTPVEVKEQSKNNNSLTLLIKDKPENDSTYYVVYKFKQVSDINISKTENIISIVRRAKNSPQYVTDNSFKTGDKCVYVVTAFDRSNNESDITGIEIN